MQNTANGSQLASTMAEGSKSGTTQPGEFIHYYTNLLTLFGEQRPVSEIKQLARAAQANRVAAMDGFSTRLADLADNYAAQRLHSGQRAAQQAQPQLQGWEQSPLPQLIAQHGGVLVAMFHYANHRHVFSDLASMGEPFVAPVAKQAYFECSELAAAAPAAFEHSMMLLEVEDRRVGRKLLSALRKGRVGLIYADGNMGPDGHLVEEGGVVVDFLGKSIRVKAGIARLAIGLGLPIVPLLVRGDREVDQVCFRPAVLPPNKAELAGEDAEHAAQRDIMQSLYENLATEVERGPERWEFAFCFHRWLDQPAADLQLDDTDAIGLDQPLWVDPQSVTQYQRADGVYWIHVGRQRAYRLPDWAAGLYQQMDGSQSLARSIDHLRCAGAEPELAGQLIDGLLELQLLGRRELAA